MFRPDPLKEHTRISLVNKFSPFFINSLIPVKNVKLESNEKKIKSTCYNLASFKVVSKLNFVSTKMNKANKIQIDLNK